MSLCLLSSSCATVARGKTQDVLISSVPSGATIIADNHVCGQTPQVLKVSRKHPHQVTLMKEGFQNENYLLNPKTNAILAGNLGFVPACAGVGATTAFILNGCSFSGFGFLGVIIFSILGLCVGTGLMFGGLVIDKGSGAANSFPSEKQTYLKPL